MSDNFDRLPDAGMGENTQTHTTGGDSTRGINFFDAPGGPFTPSLANEFRYFTGEDDTVERMKNEYGTKARNEAIAGGLTLDIQLDIAFNLIQKDRNALGRSTDVALKSAEYYFYCLDAVAKRDVVTTFLCGPGAPLYELAKAGAIALRAVGIESVERAMRTDKDRPLSRPGLGFLWAWRGLQDGRSLSPQQLNETDEKPSPRGMD